MSNPFIYGKDTTERVVSVEVQDDYVEVFTESADGVVSYTEHPYKHWALSKRQHSPAWQELAGENAFKYRRTYQSRRELGRDKDRHGDLFIVWDAKEAALIDLGITYYKGAKVSEVSTLAFDIESTTLEHTADARVLIISNTFRRAGQVERKLFCYNDYANMGEMFTAWCDWVRERDPSVVVGHNIYGFDLPYLQFCASREGVDLMLGRDQSALHIANYESRFRRDGSQDYTYNRATIYGRELVDTFFLAIRYDVGRKYDNYRLKYLVEAEGLQVEGRQFYDAGTIRDNYQNPTEWEKIKLYALFDADDALALYDRMCPAIFYLTQSVPKSYQSIQYSASGSQLNSFLIRAYLSEGHSIPEPSPPVPFEGAISHGRPGLYRNLWKQDIASLYPSIILQFQINDWSKDPKGHFLRMVNHFTKERLNNKRLAKETGDRHFKDLEQMGKIFVNSAYGFLGATGLCFNSPSKAAEVTKHGREILQQGIEWATGGRLNVQKD